LPYIDGIWHALRGGMAYLVHLNVESLFSVGSQ